MRTKTLPIIGVFFLLNMLVLAADVEFPLGAHANILCSGSCSDVSILEEGLLKISCLGSCTLTVSNNDSSVNYALEVNGASIKFSPEEADAEKRGLYGITQEGDSGMLKFTEKDIMYSYPEIRKGDTVFINLDSPFKLQPEDIILDYRVLGRPATDKEGSILPIGFCGSSFDAVAGKASSPSMFLINLPKEGSCALLQYSLYNLESKKEPADGFSYHCGEMEYFAKGGDLKGVGCFISNGTTEDTLLCARDECKASKFQLKKGTTRFTLDAESKFNRAIAVAEKPLLVEAEKIKVENGVFKNKKGEFKISEDTMLLEEETTFVDADEYGTLTFIVKASPSKPIEARFSENKLVSFAKPGMLASEKKFTLGEIRMIGLNLKLLTMTVTETKGVIKETVTAEVSTDETAKETTGSFEALPATPLLFEAKAKGTDGKEKTVRIFKPKKTASLRPSPINSTSISNSSMSLKL